ncbi:hypothetical protein Bca52824_014809 [Brassica carinata]|uniref:Uncharacterized protein n=1 Tax=Brassica carinata TaxID=52824 RepID=A0A8X7W232_BRACI|nr:hypothetical protein Bca52824_014809 [Brassica carinata]
MVFMKPWMWKKTIKDRSFIWISGLDKAQRRELDSKEEQVRTFMASHVDVQYYGNYGQRPASELHALIPELPVSDDSAKILSLQITLFPEEGFSIGVAAHHGVVDGKMSTMFVKAWAHLCKQHNRVVVVSLPETLTPSLDRSLIKDTTGLDEEMINIVRSLKQGKLIGSRTLNSVPASERGRRRLRHARAVTRRAEETWRDRESPLRRGLQSDFDPPLRRLTSNCMFPAGCFSGKTAGDFAERGFCGGGGDPQRFGERLEFEKDRRRSRKNSRLVLMRVCDATVGVVIRSPGWVCTSRISGGEDPLSHPAPDSVLNSTNLLAIPLTFFDLPWLVINPAKRVFFYRLTESTREHFRSSILPKLKLSLSLVLRNYLPLSGRLISHPNEPKPSIVVSPNDAVSLTIAETDADFSLLSSYGQHHVVPGPRILHRRRRTPRRFRRKNVNHVRQSLGSHVQTREHSRRPSTGDSNSLDRSLIKDTTGLDEQMLKIVRSLNDGGRIAGSRRNLSSIPAWERGDDGVFATLVLSRGDVERLRERVRNESGPSQLHLSTLVVSYAYVWTCLVKARGGGDMERPVSLLFVADFRERLDPPLPATYFGNCMFPAGCFSGKTAGDFAGEGGFVAAVEILSGLVKGLSSRKIETIAEEFKIGFDCVCVTSQLGRYPGRPVGCVRVGFRVGKTR